MDDKVVTNKKTKCVYTKSDIVEIVANDCNKSIAEVRDILSTFENTVAKKLATADLNTDVCVKVFEGVTIDGVFVPEKQKMNNLTGKIITTKNKIKLKANITRNYRNKIINYNQ